MGKSGRDDRLAGHDRLGQHTGCHLVLGVVRKQDDVGLLNEPVQQLLVQVVVHEVDARGDTESLGEFDEPRPVLLSVLDEDLRMRLARDEVLQRRVRLGEHRDRLDAPFDALALAEQAPGEDGRRPLARLRSRCAQVRGTVRDHVHLVAIDVVAAKQVPPTGLGHRDERVRAVDDALEHIALVEPRCCENRVEDDDDRNRRSLHQVQDIIAIRPGVDPVLVLEDHRIVGIEHLDRARSPRSRHVLVNHRSPRVRLQSGGESNDPALGPALAHALSERAGEGGEPALRRRIGTDHGDLQHDACLLLYAGPPRCTSGLICP